MALTIRVRSASFYTKVEGKRREQRLNYGDEVPSEVPSDLRKRWEETGTAAEGSAPIITGARFENPSPDSTAHDPRVGVTADGLPPEDVERAQPDPVTASVPELAEYISAEKVNASQVVAMANEDPILAAKLLEAENTAHGGDGRKTAVEPLEKLAASTA